MSSNEDTGRDQLPVAQPTQQFSLAPRDLTEAMEFAKMMAASELVPKQFRGKPGDVMIAVQMGAEVGMQPMAAIQNIAVINGKPGIYGDAGKAILLAAGCIIEEDNTDKIKSTGVASCTITRGRRPPVTRTFSVEDAKTANLWNKEGPWRQYPYRQMAWRAFWFAARDAAADLLKGLGGAEELSDFMKDLNEPPARAAQPARGSAAPKPSEIAQAQRQSQNAGPSPELLASARAAADKGRDGFGVFWKSITPAERNSLRDEIADLGVRTEKAEKARTIEMPAAEPMDDDAADFARQMDEASGQADEQG